MQRDKRKVTI